MTHRNEPQVSGSSLRAPIGWLLGIVGGISTFLGLFILFGPEDQYIGIGGDLSWRVGDIPSGWMYGLLAGGVAALAIGLAMVILGGRQQVQAGDRPHGLSELWWHTGTFVVVNAFIWLQDIAIGGGVDYAYWVTIPWAIGLGTHAYLYSTHGRHAAAREDRPSDFQAH